MPPSWKSFCDARIIGCASSAAACASFMAAREAARSSGRAPFWSFSSAACACRTLAAPRPPGPADRCFPAPPPPAPCGVGSPSFTETSFSRPTTREASLISCELRPPRARAPQCASRCFPRETRTWFSKPEESCATERREHQQRNHQHGAQHCEHVDVSVSLWHKKQDPVDGDTVDGRRHTG